MSSYAAGQARAASFAMKSSRRLELLLEPENAWRVTLDERDQLEWTSSAGAVNAAPVREGNQRAADFLFRWMPLEGQP